MKQSVRQETSQLPGSKRHREAALTWTERATDGSEHQRTAGRAERAAVLTAAPAVSLVGALASDGHFTAGLKRVLAGEESAADLAARYQRRNSYGFRVMLFLVESAVQSAIRLGHPRGLGVGLMLTVPPVAFLEEGEPAPQDRKRFRPLGWRVDAVQALIDRGVGDSPARTPIGVPQTHPEQAQRRHDAAVESVRNLLAEFGTSLGVE